MNWHARWIAAALLTTSAAHASDVTVKLDGGGAFRVESAGAVERLRVDEATGNVSRNGALFVHTTGFQSLFVGNGAGNPASANLGNSAFGFHALAANTTGSANSAFGTTALEVNTTGALNTAFGSYALLDNTTGNFNTAVGSLAMASNSVGSENSAFGQGALRLGGNANSAFGHRVMYATSGSANAGFGNWALVTNTTGSDNVAFGFYALASNATGSRNVAIGSMAGGNATGSDNIYLANPGLPGGESGQIRIGNPGIHTQAHIAGIHGQTVTGGSAVLVDALGKLGTSTSSARFKQDVRDMGEASDVVMRLRPVTFHYREEAVGAEEAQELQYGLIAEEVAAVSPELVAPDAEGKPYSVRYHVLPALLLNEVQEQQRTIARLEARIAELERQQPRAQASR